MPFLIGLIVLFVLYIFFYRIWSKNWNPAELVIGQDKRPSSSKFQFLLWTVVVLYSYIVVYTARAWNGYYQSIDQIPVNLFIVMGFSIATAAAAKGITVGYLETGRIAKPEPTATRADPENPQNDVTGEPLKKRAGWSAILVDDQGYPDLSKLQMIAWTFIAIGIYLIGLGALVKAIPNALQGVTDNAGNPMTWSNLTPKFLENNPELAQRISLPDISAALMVLMGLGQGAYLGKKLVTVNTARLTQLTPSAGKPGSEVAISGVSLSEAPDGNQVTLNGKPYEPPATVVSASQIKFTFPQKQADGATWKPGEVVAVGVISGGQSSANTLLFTLTVPVLNRLSESQGAANTQITLFGTAFGSTQGASKVLIDDAPYAASIPASDWTETEIKITIPATLTAGAHHIAVAVDGQTPTNPLTFTIT